ncbi:MAG: hypothetical protein RIA69_06340 [Cyclobacteriaceae bacterium]
MKKTTQFLTTLVFLSLSIFISCGGDDAPTPPDVRIAQGALATGTFSESGVTADNSAREEWDGFSLTMTYDATTFTGGFTATGVPSNDGASAVWPASGTWTFGGTAEAPDLNTIVRSDGVSMDANISATALTLSFNIPEAAPRTFDGNWVFSFSK